MFTSLLLTTICDYVKKFMVGWAFSLLDKKPVKMPISHIWETGFDTHLQLLIPSSYQHMLWEVVLMVPRIRF